ncbi:DEAD/DEAH box helicase [Halosquirtibacter xylanolyticus]|uniref:DEAD/DEAH box helicase n=1 Tax=Halosquirtibacter xylanolyticus TaxID=3374599 RepID=UPI0037496032|nr:DEAD/DEAH box helicase [Prolixibacteraceae bacterium]
MKDISKYILEKMSFERYNEVQDRIFEASKSDDTLYLVAPTGSGKTIAFLRVMFEKTKPIDGVLQMLVLVPTRELALQIEKVVAKLQLPFRAYCAYGGHSIASEERSLERTPSLLIATPGRLADHIRRGNIDLSKLSHVVLDEYDKILQFGYKKDIDFIFRQVDRLKGAILTSATQLPEMNYPEGIDKNGTVIDLSEKVKANTFRAHRIDVEGTDKLAALVRLLEQIGSESTMVFCNHRDAVERISDALYDLGIVHESIHGQKTQDERERAMIKFENGTSSIILGTDLLARGIDHLEVQHIVHYQMPRDLDVAVHRNGRTSRGDKEGNIYVVLKEDETLSDALSEIDWQKWDLDQIFPEIATPYWDTLYIGAGKKNKINKIDIVGFLCQKGGLEKREIGMIQVKDYRAYVAVPRNKMRALIQTVKRLKIKGKGVIIDRAF